MNLYNEDYFENGVESGLSLYENYRWMPERTIPEAHWIIEHTGASLDDLIIDFGCAKGFHVKALRLLGYKAFGYDISGYALGSADEKTKKYISNKLKGHYNIGVCKDTLEHCKNKRDLRQCLKLMGKHCYRWLVIVPTAIEGEYVIPEYEKDKTHNIRYSAIEWDDAFRECGFDVELATYGLSGIKTNWKQYKDGNLFYIINK